MAVIGTLFDDFNDNSVNATKWPNNYGTVSETGGRARVTCDTDYAAYASDVTYSFDETVMFCRLFSPADAGATDEAYIQALVVSVTAGTDLGFEVNAATGEFSCFTRVGYFDAGLVSLTYSATDHAYGRIVETGGNTIWSTSPDGITWTTRRTVASSAWEALSTNQVQLLCHRDGGTNDFGEFDNFNTLSGSSIAGAASATGTASNATTSIRPSAAVTSATGTASNATTSIKPTSGVASATGTASNATGSIAPHAGASSATCSAHDATVATSTGTDVSAQVASTTGTASGATGSIAPHAGAASTTGTASAPGGSAAGGGVGVATGTGTASNATTSVAPHAGAASATCSAHDATTLTGTLAAAVVASTTGTAHAPGGSASTRGASVASATGTANSVTGSIGASAAAASGSGVASGAVGSVAPHAGAGSATGSAHDGDPDTATGTDADAGAASGSGTASGATTSITPRAGVGSATCSAHNATVSLSVSAHPDAATAGASAGQPGGSGSPHAGLAAVVVIAGVPTVAIAPAAGPAGLTATGVGISGVDGSPGPRPAVAVGIARPPRIVITGSGPVVGTATGWNGLLGILRSGTAEIIAERSQAPTACPHDGEPLMSAPDGGLFCRFDGWRP